MIRKKMKKLGTENIVSNEINENIVNKSDDGIENPQGNTTKDVSEKGKSIFDYFGKEGIERIVKMDQIMIDGIIFNHDKRINQISCEFDSSLQLQVKNTFDSIQKIMKQIQSIDSKGFLNHTNLIEIPVISKFVGIFTENDLFIRGEKSSELYK
jgi:hypothetical protein